MRSIALTLASILVFAIPSLSVLAEKPTIKG